MPGICVRYDTPQSDPCGYKPPKVLESQRLNRLDVLMGGQLVRRYDLSHAASASSAFYVTSTDGDGVPACSPWVGYLSCSGGNCSPSRTSSNGGYRGGTDLLTGV